jgi:hypothetical protein
MIGVARQTLEAWTKRHPEFADAISKGKASSQYWFEKNLLGLVDGSIVGRERLTATIFALKTRFHEDFGDQNKKEIKEHVEGIEEYLIRLKAELKAGKDK